MAQEYISYIQTENLLRAWPTIQGIKESLDRELNLYKYTNKMGNRDDYIYTKVIGNKELSDMPSSGRLPDTTGDTAINIEKMWDKDMADMREKLIEEKYCIELVDDKLNIAFRRLSVMQQEILRLFYMEDKTWAEVLDLLKKYDYMSKRQAQNRRREAIERVQSISKITVEMYEYVMDLVEVE